MTTTNTEPLRCPTCDGAGDLPVLGGRDGDCETGEHVECEDCDGAGHLACAICGDEPAVRRIRVRGVRGLRWDPSCEACATARRQESESEAA